LIVMALIVVGAVSILRPEQLPGSEDFKQGSAAQRILVGYAGLQIFADHPVAGVGWRQSSQPDVIGDREVAIAVRRRFPDVRKVLYPDVTPTTVHNTYIQVLAELGIIGFLLFAAMIVTIGYRVVDLIRRLGASHPLYRPAFVMALVLVSSLIFHNEVPLFGGQAETIIPVMIVGVLAAISRIDLEDRLIESSRGAPGRRIRSL
jgi:O-antigen ligase